MSIRLISCPAFVIFTEQEMAELAAIEAGGPRLEPLLWCTLHVGHSGSHWGMAQEVRDYAVWMRWDDSGGNRELLPHPYCQARFLDGTLEAQGCGLPQGHVGRHGFEFGPPLRAEDLPPEEG